MALILPAADPALSARDLAASITKSTSFSHIISLQDAPLANQSDATETQAPSLHLKQQCASSIVTALEQTGDCGIRSEPVLDCVAGSLPHGWDTAARTGPWKPLRQVRRQFSLFQKVKTKWSDPKASVGKFCGMKGKYSCWEAKGPAEDTFTRLSKDIATLLERTCGPVPASSQVIYDIFMVGETPATAVPQIMFSCRKVGPRKEAMETLKKSGLLISYPGIETGHWQFPPHILDPRLLASEEEPNYPTETANSPLLRLLVPIYESSIKTSPSTPSTTISVIRLYTVNPSEPRSASLKATVGSLTCFAGKTFYVSVSHAFVRNDYNNPEPFLGTEDDDDDSEFQFGGLGDGEEDFGELDDEELEIDDSGSMTSESSGSQDDFSPDVPIDESSESFSLVGSDASLRMPKPTDMDSSHNRDSLEIRSTSPSTPLVAFSGNQQANADFATIYLESTDLDYALIEPSSDHNITPALSRLPMISSSNIGEIPPGETRVMTMTGSSGLSYGILSGRPSYIRLMSSKTFQETYTVTIDGPLMPGDSGSVVVSPDTLEVYGHMVVGSSISRTAYIIPASNVLKDLRLREEAISSTTIEFEALSKRTENSEDEACPRPSELNSQPESGDQALLPTNSSLASQCVGRADDAPLCTYEFSLCSEVESIFSDNESIASSNSSVGEFRSSALSEIVNLLFHSELKNLYPAAITKLGPVRFQRNFRRFLLIYGRQLEREATNHLERQAAILVRRSATQIAVQIRECIPQDADNSTIKTTNSAQLNEWLQSVKGQDDEKDDDDLYDSSESDEWEPHGNASLDTLEGVKSFMVAGRAFLDLCETFKQWLKLGEDPKGKAPVRNTVEFTERELQEVQTLANNETLPSSSPWTSRPMNYEKETPAGAIISPPDSEYSTSDDEHVDRFAQVGDIDNLAKVRAAISATEQFRADWPDFEARSSDGPSLRRRPYLMGSTPYPARNRQMALSIDIPEDETNNARESFTSSLNFSSPNEDVDSEIEGPQDGLSENKPKPAILNQRRPKTIPRSPVFSKAVHFDSHLERVRHFLQVDRPLAVSSGLSLVEPYDSDDEFPFTFTNSSSSERIPRSKFEWELYLSDFPAETPARLQLPVRVEKVFLSADNKHLIGHIVVANLGYNKIVTARFTLDYWKTTSEVQAGYKSEVEAKDSSVVDAEDNSNVRQRKESKHDRFNFTINLADQANLEARTMLFCVRYTVNGQEYWDNNDSRNFQVDFRMKLKRQSKKPKKPFPIEKHPDHFDSDDSDSEFDAMPFNLLGDGGAQKLTTRSMGPLGESPARMKGAKIAPIPRSSSELPRRPSSENDQAFSYRYDFGLSLTEAIKAANATLGDKSSFSKKKPSAANPTSNILHSTPVDTQERGLNPSTESYNELLDKYCFVRMSPFIVIEDVELILIVRFRRKSSCSEA